MFIDTHAHIYLDQFKDDFSEVIERAKKANVSHILMPNIDRLSIEDVFRCANSHPNYCRTMVGLHPCSISKNFKHDLEALQPYINEQEVIAVGEIGIDLYWDRTFKIEQEKAFREQIEWALSYDLPIVIHSRSSIDITIKIVSEMQNGNLRGVFHCFDQGLKHANKIIELGFYMGIGGIITYKKNEEIRKTVAQVPLEHIILETDAPYLPPAPYRGKRNESSYVPIIAEKLSQIMNVNIAKIANTTTKNAKALFQI